MNITKFTEELIGWYYEFLGTKVCRNEKIEGTEEEFIEMVRTIINQRRLKWLEELEIDLKKLGMRLEDLERRAK